MEIHVYISAADRSTKLKPTYIYGHFIYLCYHAEYMAGYNCIVMGSFSIFRRYLLCILRNISRDSICLIQ